MELDEVAQLPGLLPSAMTASQAAPSAYPVAAGSQP